MDSEELAILRDIRDGIRRLETIVRAMAVDDGVELEGCPNCGSTDILDASAMGDEKYICRGCNQTLRKQVA